MSTARIKISAYVGFIASGSDISNPEADPASGYDDGLVRELARVGTRGGTVTLTSAGLRDLAEFCDALAVAEAQGGNPSGARALDGLGSRCLALAIDLDS
jgi:hypothetical protein